eukprot:CAMPEP_0176312276 /NCGR_PEP_ID=MMETSP0121_2-20121125/66582_1 /TAXON_ID=160619 /ORGANISM="Kryptoperidinium foliaceum, Strain CCMP 1326" /LENGTH=49 /DNA_ID= /DNA_START= /DNA_END= /DNA_ORIENTATION=
MARERTNAHSRSAPAYSRAAPTPHRCPPLPWASTRDAWDQNGKPQSSLS